MTEITHAHRRCVQTNLTLSDIARLLSQLITTLEKRQDDQAIKAGTLDRCRHNLQLIEKGIEKISNLLQQTDNTAEIYQQLDRILADMNQAGKWQPGAFLQALQQQLQALEHSWQQPISENKPTRAPLTIPHTLEQSTDTTATEAASLTETTTVFVHLYQATGKSLETWLPQLHNLHHLIQSRPVYATQQDVLAVLTERGHSSTDAYVALLLPKQALATNFHGSAPTDKYGYTLIRIDSDACPQQFVIDHFYHCQQQYHLVDGELIKL